MEIEEDDKRPTGLAKGFSNRAKRGSRSASYRERCLKRQSRMFSPEVIGEQVINKVYDKIVLLDEDQTEVISGHYSTSSDLLKSSDEFYDTYDQLPAELSPRVEDEILNPIKTKSIEEIKDQGEVDVISDAKAQEQVFLRQRSMTIF